MSAQGDWQHNVLRDLGSGNAQPMPPAADAAEAGEFGLAGAAGAAGVGNLGGDAGNSPYPAGSPPAASSQGPGPYAPQPQPGQAPQQVGQQRGPVPGARSVRGLSHAAPDSVPVLPAELGNVPGKARHGESVGRRLGRAVRNVFISSTVQKTGEAARYASAIQQPVTTGRQIAVSSIRGGAGKSTVAALLALGYAHYRTDPVLTVEADPALGTLPHRLGAGEVRWSCSDLARILDPSLQITDVTGYLLPYPGGGWLLPGSQGAVGSMLDVDSYRIVMTSLRRYFAATVVDCETLPAEVARTAMVTTHARVLVAPATTEGVATTRTVLDWLGGVHRSVLPTTVVVLTHPGPDVGVNMTKAAEYLGATGAAVLPLPYDRHLAAGGAVQTGLLAEHTRTATARIAAEVMNRSTSREPGKTRQASPEPGSFAGFGKGGPAQAGGGGPR